MVGENKALLFYTIYIKKNKNKSPNASNFIKKETLALVFSCEFCDISKSTFFTEHLWTTASSL